MFPGLSESSSGGTLFSSRSADSRMSASWERVFDLGELGVTRWLEKRPVPSAVQAQEPKTKVVPSGTLLALLDPAIEFVGELAESPTFGSTPCVHCLESIFLVYLFSMMSSLILSTNSCSSKPLNFLICELKLSETLFVK